jgi:topoisomerase-4 subunit A
VQRRTRHRLDKVLDRIHVLEGRQLVLLNIDEVIRIIRNADEPKPALIERFRLSDRQAEDILEIRLRQLARLEAIRIEQELKELRAEQAKLQEILDSPSALKRTVIREIEADAKAHGDERRTLIQAEKRAVAEIKVVDEPVTVVVSLKGWVRALKGHEVDPASLSFKAGDALYGVFPCRSVDTLSVLGSGGRVYSAAVSALPGGRGDGQPITSMIDLEPGTQPVHYLAGAADQGVLVAGTGGFGLVARLGDLATRQKGGKAWMSLEPGEHLVAPALLPAGVDDPGSPSAAGVRVAALTLAGRLLVFGLDELKRQPNGGRGLTLVDLDAKDAVVSVAVVREALRVHGVGRGDKPREELLRGAALSPYVGKRARKGKALELGFKPKRVVAG